MDCVQCEEGPEILYEIRVIVTFSVAWNVTACVAKLVKEKTFRKAASFWQERADVHSMA